jgi:diguanylate cyclase (GGDEF)-like protein/PAS domain S-box-containing protein
VVITDREGTIEYVNPTFETLTGYSAEEVLGKNTRIFKSGEHPPEFYEQMWRALRGGMQWRGEFRNVKKNGELYWESASISPVAGPDGGTTHFVAVKEDITERKAAEEALKESEEKYRLLFSKEFDAVALLDGETMRFLEVNDAHVRMFGYSREEIPRIDALALCAEPDAALAEWKRLLEERSHSVPLLRVLRKDGTALPVEVSAGTFTWRGKLVACVVMRDITERLKWQELMEKLSSTDPLTGLANRRIFDEALETEWARATRAKSPLSLLMADIDSFKEFNDRYGHQAGDGCLKRIAAELAACARRPGDLVARYGGEEFGVILPATDERGAEELAEAMRKRVEDLEIPCGNGCGACTVTLSVGVATAFARLDGVSPVDLLEAADRALYDAKSTGRNRISVAREVLGRAGNGEPDG